MSQYLRYTGEVRPRASEFSPLSLRLPREVYALDGCATGPEVHPPGRPHFHEVRCDTSFDAGHRHSLGQFSPEEARRGNILSEIARLKRAGRREDQIRSHLLRRGSLPTTHPCSGPRGRNLCTSREIDLRMAEAQLRDYGRSVGVLESLLILGGVAGALWLLRRRR